MAPRDTGDRFLFFAYLALLLWIPLPIWKQCPLGLVLAGSLGIPDRGTLAPPVLPRPRQAEHALCSSVARDSCVLLATLSWIVLQAIPLPAEVTRILSPRAFEIQSAVKSYPEPFTRGLRDTPGGAANARLSRAFLPHVCCWSTTASASGCSCCRSSWEASFRRRTDP